MVSEDIYTVFYGNTENTDTAGHRKSDTHLNKVSRK